MPTSNAAALWRSPTARIALWGAPVRGLLRAEVISNGYFGADTFSASMAIGADPRLTVATLSSTGSIPVEIGFSLDGQNPVSFITGETDRVELDPVAGTVDLVGRDLSARLIEARTQETFANRTASEIAAILAARHGLVPVVTPTTTPVGRYYHDEHDRITLGAFSHATTEWDLLVYLARLEGFDVFVSGQELHFQPRQPDAGPAYVIAPSALTELRLSRSLTFAGDIAVTVKSWNSAQKTSFTQIAMSSLSGATANPSAMNDQVRQYVFVRPNLTPAQALQYAQARLAELTRHEKLLTATMPGELTMKPRNAMLLQGTGSAFDQAYHIDTIMREYRGHGGFRQRIRARNASARNQTTVPADLVGAVTG